MLRDLKKQGFASIVEIVVTTIVFVLAAAGILSTMIMFRPQGKTASLKVEAAYIGRGIIDDLRQQVNAEDWNLPGSSLEPGDYTVTIGDYTVDYTIGVGTDLRRLTMNITFPDP